MKKKNYRKYYKKKPYNPGGGPYCPVCMKQIKTVTGCWCSTVTINGNKVNRIPVEKEDITDGSLFCNSCGARIGEYHHVYCENERCPVCKGQLLAHKLINIRYGVFEADCL